MRRGWRAMGYATGRGRSGDRPYDRGLLRRAVLAIMGIAGIVASNARRYGQLIRRCGWRAMIVNVDIAGIVASNARRYGQLIRRCGWRAMVYAANTSSGASRHLPLKGKAILAGACRIVGWAMRDTTGRGRSGDRPYDREPLRRAVLANMDIAGIVASNARRYGNLIRPCGWQAMVYVTASSSGAAGGEQWFTLRPPHPALRATFPSRGRLYWHARVEL